MTANRGQDRRGGRAALLAGLFLSPAAWFVSQQAAGAYLRVNCAGGGLLGAVLFGLGLLACALAAWIVRRPAATAALDIFLRRLAQIAAAVFALAIVYQGLAALIVPSCAR